MTEITAATLHQQVIDAVDWAGVHHIVHVGGGDGTLLAAILDRRPGATGLLFDQPQVVVEAALPLEAAGVADRVDVESGSFFDAVPPGGDLYLLADVLGSWDDEDAARILGRCRSAMAPSARLLVCELAAQDRTPGAWDALLESAGFELVAVTDTEPAWIVVEASPRR